MVHCYNCFCKQIKSNCNASVWSVLFYRWKKALYGNFSAWIVVDMYCTGNGGVVCSFGHKLFFLESFTRNRKVKKWNQLTGYDIFCTVLTR